MCLTVITEAQHIKRRKKRAILQHVTSVFDAWISKSCFFPNLFFFSASRFPYTHCFSTQVSVVLTLLSCSPLHSPLCMFCYLRIFLLVFVHVQMCLQFSWDSSSECIISNLYCCYVTKLYCCFIFIYFFFFSLSLLLSILNFLSLFTSNLCLFLSLLWRSPNGIHHIQACIHAHMYTQTKRNTGSKIPFIFSHTVCWLVYISW